MYIKEKINNNKINNNNGITRFRILAIAISASIPLFAATITINSTNSTNSNTIFAMAQSGNANTTSSVASGNLDIFHARGTINSLTSDVLTGTPSTTDNKTETYILGGDWNFDVVNGKLQDFKANIVMAPIDGSRPHFHSISKLNNVTAAIEPINYSKSIFLRKDNFTGFKGLADITTNGKPKWQNVPVEVYILGGNIINMHINSEKSDNHFKNFPVYGIVRSITSADNKPIRVISVPHY